MGVEKARNQVGTYIEIVLEDNSISSCATSALDPESLVRNELPVARHITLFPMVYIRFERRQISFFAILRHPLINDQDRYSLAAQWNRTGNRR